MCQVLVIYVRLMPDYIYLCVPKQTYGFVDEENDMHAIRFAAETLQAVN